MGGLLQLPPAPRSPRWADSLRAALGKETACQRVTEVLDLDLLARPERFELPTPWFVARYSIQLSYGRASVDYSGRGVAPPSRACTLAVTSRGYGLVSL